RFWHEVQAEAGNSAFHFDRMLEREPDNPEWHFQRAEAYARAGDLARAEQCYDRTAALGMNRAGLWINRGFLHQQRKRWLEAEADFSRALALVPGDRSVWYRRGTVRAEAGRWVGAAGDLDRALWLLGLGAAPGTLGGLDYVYWHGAAYAHLGAGDLAAYRQRC